MNAVIFVHFFIMSKLLMVEKGVRAEFENVSIYVRHQRKIFGKSAVFINLRLNPQH